tara:strand:+ start:104 stop:712 length:609 start_codon:yes stop_codon:yes gene_type:complete
MPKKLVILDIDQTLIHSLLRKDPKLDPAFTIDIRGDKYFIHKRNFLKRFIQGLQAMLSPDFKVAVWTAAQRNYAIKIMDKIWPAWRDELLFLRSSGHCTALPTGEIVKDMTMLPQGYDTILVDDNSSNFQINTVNNFSVWKIAPFTHTSIDSELKQVLKYITECTNQSVPFAVRPKTPSRLKSIRSPSRKSSLTHKKHNKHQ